MPTDPDASWKEIVLLNEGVYKIWSLYISWYTWFFGANLLVLSWLFTNQSSAFHANKASVCGIWVVMNGLGATTSILLSLHSIHINRRIRDLLRARGPDTLVEADDILPRRMTAWGGIANAIALMINAALWAALYSS